MNITLFPSFILFVAGLFFLLVGSIGLIRFPDFYSRAHAVGIGDTLGVILIILGLIWSEGFTLNSAKLFFILVFVMLTNPTATHALVKAAFKFRLLPWFKPDKDGE